MKKKELEELKMKTVTELKRFIVDLRDEVGKLRIEKGLGKLRDTNAIKNKNKAIARALTFLSIKSLKIDDSREKGDS